MWTGAVVQLGSSSRPGTRNTFQNKFLPSLHSIIIILLLLALQNNFQGIFSRGKSLTVSERHIWMVHERTVGRRMGQAEVVTIAFATIKSAWPGGGQEVRRWREGGDARIFCNQQRRNVYKWDSKNVKHYYYIYLITHVLCAWRRNYII